MGVIATIMMMVSSTGSAEMAQTLEWDDLISPQARERAMLNSSKQSEAPLVDHNAVPVEQSYSPDMAEVNLALNGKLVRLAGFIVPLEGHDNKVTAFLLVPYFGACIHVPPPPANQIVYVTYPKGIEADLVYDPIWVTGPIQAGMVSTEMAESGYSIAAESIAPYELTDDESIVTDDETVIK
jgi:hypothetical protein